MLDESDITLVLNPKLRKYFEFDKNKQEIKLVDKYYWDEEKKKNVEWKLPDDLPEELKPFIKKLMMMNINILSTVKNISLILFKSSIAFLTVETYNYQKDCLLCPPTSENVKFVRTQVMS